MPRAQVFRMEIDGIVGYHVLAEGNGSRVVGSVTLTLWPEFPLLTNLYVAPAFRRQGLARHIVRAALAIAHAHTEVPVQVYYQAPESRQLFASMGFTETPPPADYELPAAFTWASAPRKAA